MVRVVKVEALILLPMLRPIVFSFSFFKAWLFHPKENNPSQFSTQNFQLRILGGYAIIVNIGIRVLQRNLGIVAAL
ncbi:hypothetical protein V6N13_043534 [Hibiscus sabdariffa]|uniref:Uncharacterized protein n=1 Tax=Hibiscus sabdariffa TaxID=183260 RepID=A0ABR1ZBG2_9ROSI